MTETIRRGDWRSSPLRALMWGGAALLLLLPLVAMQFTREVNWDGADFIFAAVMLGVACGTIEIAARTNPNAWYRAGAIVAVAASFLLIWVNGAVGFLGDEDNPANLMFLGVIVLAILGSFVVRFRAPGMAKTMTAAAAAQLLVALIGYFGGYASPGGAGVYEVVMGTTLFGGLWLLSAWFFRRVTG